MDFNKSKTISQNMIYVGFISEEKLRGLQSEIGEDCNPLILRYRSMCFSPRYSLQVAPQRCPLRFTRRRLYTSIPISAAKVLHLFDIRK